MSGSRTESLVIKQFWLIFSVPPSAGIPPFCHVVDILCTLPNDLEICSHSIKIVITYLSNETTCWA